MKYPPNDVIKSVTLLTARSKGRTILLLKFLVHVFDEGSLMEINEITIMAFWGFFDVPKIQEKTSLSTRSRLPALVF